MNCQEDYSMAIRYMTDKTGQRIAVALEKQGAAADIGKNKIPKLPDGTIARRSPQISCQ